MKQEIECGDTLERILFKKAYDKLLPIYGVLELTPLCNMNCDMCYVRLSNEEINKKGRLRSLEEWISLVDEMKNNGVLFVLLTGGEPLLYPWFKELYLYLIKVGMIVTINTNGTLIDDEWIHFFNQHRPRRINITIYGDDEKTYEDLCHYSKGFNKALNALKMFKKYDIPVKINGSLTKINMQCADGILDIGEQLDIPVRIDTYMCPGVRERNKPFAFQNRMDPITAARTRMKVLHREMGDEVFFASCKYELDKINQTNIGENQPYNMKCKAGRCSFTINWQGKMRPCVIMTEPSIDVFELGFKEAWKLLVEKTRSIKGGSKCNQCKLRNYCNTCPAYALLEEGKYYSIPKYICEYTKESVRLMKSHIKNLK